MGATGLNEQTDGLGLDWTSLTGLLEAGGPAMWVIVSLSVIGLAIVLVKLTDFAAAGVWRQRAADAALAAWCAGERETALERVAEARGPVAAVLRTAMAGHQDARVPNETAREEVARCGARWLERLRGGLRPLELIGTLAPLLGLLGTVLGMIDAFRELENAGSRVDPAVLSGGIWVALLTTAAGLSVGIPAVAASTWIERTLERLHHRMQDAATRVFTAVPGTALTAESERPTPRDNVAHLAEAAGAD